uniref:Uncharacterized protein n=1 Tax=Arundo donax TaxID=35708 RepID=A0A0A8ZFT8_ARUDO
MGLRNLCQLNRLSSCLAFLHAHLKTSCQHSDRLRFLEQRIVAPPERNFHRNMKRTLMTCTSNMSNWRFQTEWHHWESARDSTIRKGTIRLMLLLPSITPVNNYKPPYHKNNTRADPYTIIVSYGAANKRYDGIHA